MPSNPKKGRAGNCKRNDAGHLSDAPTGEKNTYMLHGPRNPMEECKVLQEYSEKHIAQQPFKDKQDRSGGNKGGKTVKF